MVLVGDLTILNAGLLLITSLIFPEGQELIIFDFGHLLFGRQDCVLLLIIKFGLIVFQSESI
jgi:hypothetical protein